MPELFRAYGYVFMFFSLEHLPIRIHVVGNDGDVNTDIIIKHLELFFKEVDNESN